MSSRYTANRCINEQSESRPTTTNKPDTNQTFAWEQTTTQSLTMLKDLRSFTVTPRVRLIVLSGWRHLGNHAFNLLKNVVHKGDADFGMPLEQTRCGLSNANIYPSSTTQNLWNLLFPSPLAVLRSAQTWLSEPRKDQRHESAFEESAWSSSMLQVTMMI